MPNYTEHLTEKIRMDIGRLLIKHELKKLFPKLDYLEIQKNINVKLELLKNEADIRDFWNLVDALMMGYKLKNIAKEITSEAYSWELNEQQPIENLRFTSKINGLEINKKTAKEVKDLLEANPTELQRIKEATLNEFPKNDSRWRDPIIVFAQNEGTYTHDGNGRLLKAVIDNAEHLKAYIGTIVPCVKTNHWVPTSYLMRLSEMRSKELLLVLLKESDNAVVEFTNRVETDHVFKQVILKQLGENPTKAENK